MEAALGAKEARLNEAQEEVATLMARLRAGAPPRLCPRTPSRPPNSSRNAATGELHLAAQTALAAKQRAAVAAEAIDERATMLGEVQTALGISAIPSLSQTVNEAAAMRRALSSHREETEALREERATLRASLEEEQAQNLLAPVCRSCRRAPALRTQLLPGAQPPTPLPPLHVAQMRCSASHYWAELMRR